VKIRGPYRPQYQTDGAAGFDLAAHFGLSLHVEIQPGETVVVPTGLRMEIPEGYEVQIRPRSGLARRGLVAAFGTVDSDYRGEIGVILHNNSDMVKLIEDGDRIAQGVLCPVTRANFEFVNEVSQTARGSGGFGSTGV
jgi:dUTP pyrophosphatase